ncbi:MAG TPA: Stp1/IreP family PP2C-type Ser/Thr phosphatase [Polyangiaceae bacterium]|nr:Stp1/IreP family PP2C-type Ser/Thr phosphatase [Polyangiaceae bacterium]
MRAIAAGLSDVGLQREHNEDSFIVLKEYDLFVVADGMGGHRAGDVASRLATETISEFFKSTANEDVTWPFHFDTNLSEEENRLLTGIRVANRQIFERSTRSREYHGMGTTVVGAMFSPSKRRMYIGHVGDSRCYRIREGQIRLLTRDHSLINDYLLAMPDLTEEQRSELPKNVITRALGMQDQVVVDLQHDDPKDGDVYVLCSDGLSGMIVDDEIKRIVSVASNISEACRNLIEKANEHGGEDNITAVLVKIEERSDAEEPDTSSSRDKSDDDTVAEDQEDEDTTSGFVEEPTHPGLLETVRSAEAEGRSEPVKVTAKEPKSDAEPAAATKVESDPKEPAAPAGKSKKESSEE